MNSNHKPVLLDEVIKALNIHSDGFYIDGTFGRGGHSREIIKRLGRKGRLLAFDKDKYRLGYGKGYYDRYLNKYIKQYKKDTITVGVAFSFQKHNKLPINKNDVKMDFILTEKGIY